MELHRKALASVMLVALAALLVSPWATLAQSGVQVEIGAPDFAGFPSFTVPVVVVDGNGVPIQGLDSANFEAFEEGNPLPITSVTERVDADRSMAVALVLDLSRSVPAEEVKAAANTFLSSLGPNVRVALIGFNDSVSFTGFDPAKEIDFTTDHAAIRQVVDQLEFGGGSAIYEAIYKGVLITAEEVADRRAVIVMTDGYDTASRAETATSDTPRTAAKEKGIPVFTIGAYSPDQTMGRDETFVNLLARETGGSYVEATDFAMLAEQFSAVVEQLGTEYEIALRTSLQQDGRDRVIGIRATTNAGTGSADRTASYPAPPAVPTILKVQREINEELQDLSAGAELTGKVLLVPQIASQNSLVKVEYYVDDILRYTAMVDQMAATDYRPWEWRWNAGSVDEGPHTIKVVAYDDAGNISDPYALDVQAMGGAGVNLWLILAIVAAVILLGIALFLILRKPKASGPRTVPEMPTYTTPGSDFGETATAPDTFGPPSLEPTPQEAWNTVPSTSTSPYPDSGTQVVPSKPRSSGGGYTASASEGVTNETMSLQRAPEAMGWLIMQKGASVGREFRLHEVTNIGRRGDNDIVLDDVAVSRQHAKIRLQGDKFVIADMGASNCTKVNDQEIARHTLQDGDVVEIGQTRFVFKQVAAS